MTDGKVDWAEKRNALRQRTLKQGRVVVNGLSTLDCMIRNMSLTGARISVPNPAALPDQFTLLIGSEGLKRDCEVMSRTGNAAGLRFMRPLNPRELGAEFMSAKRSDTGVNRAERVLEIDQKGHASYATVERGSAVPSSSAGSREAIAPPTLEAGHPVRTVLTVAPPDLGKIVPNALPETVRDRLPW